MDNFEWNHGMGYQFGLYAVDKNDPQKKRVARAAVPKFLEITKANDVPAALEKQFPAPE
jgi:beta-glucosidase/6-phospho-beta-glucosidase/beta-galactosidase